MNADAPPDEAIPTSGLSHPIDHPSVRPSVCISIYPSIWLSGCPTVCLPDASCVHLSVCPKLRPWNALEYVQIDVQIQLFELTTRGYLMGCSGFQTREMGTLYVQW